ncbi:penicillin-binding protein [Patescibacteria group bacterium]|nr:penicillin-binding protein [Patescibacteria group bacterium]MBU1473053.1 penicillin-binding protein [Patescibacteria group bacterium]MBU2460191.1 penicillin-binding protein [Patescibacteria group bacterium]MBU2543922.1 penicillin-binding protein [Patescibacteria group bacterium]
MARRNNPKQKGLKNTTSPSLFHWWPVIVCIKIGDFVRHIFRFVIRMVLIFAGLVVRTFRKGWNDIRRMCLSTRPHIRIPKLRRVAIRLPSFPLPRHPIAFPSFFHDMRSFLFGVAVTVLFFFIPYQGYQMLKSLPDPHLLTSRDLEVSTKIFDRNGILLYEIYADQNRTPLTLSEIPQTVINATIAIEDHDFYRHLGFSGRGILRALKETVVNKQIQGGSTITQQLIRSALLTPELSIRRKLKEIFLAFWAERIYSKDQILEMYFNQVPYGGTAWGIEAASQMYFGKSVKELTLSESALLAGLPAAPSEYSPFGNHPEKAFARQAEVLRLMTEYGYIGNGDEEKALSEQMRFATPRIPIRAPHFVMFVKEILEATYGPRLVERGGLRIVTSLDITLQEKVEDIIRSQIESLAALRVGNGAALVTNPKTGEILSMVGSKDYFNLEDEGNVNVATSLRQPGSSIKVVNYAAALENGFTAATIIDDSPVVYTVPGSKPYAPVNYDGKFHGPTPLRYALANSYNVPAVKVLSKIGVQTMINKGRLMGITSWQDESRYGLSLTLGGGDVTMLDMAKVYGTLANGGRRGKLIPILEVTDYTGHILEHHTPKKGVQAVTPEVAWILGNILSDNDARAAAFGRGSSLVIPGHTVSVKTGTSNDKRDNWTIGYAPSYVVVVWVGNNNNAPMDPYLTSGITGASPIWHDIMIELLKDKEDEVLPKPSGVVAIPCYFGRTEYFIRGTEPKNGRCAVFPVPSPTPAESQE